MAVSKRIRAFIYKRDGGRCLQCDSKWDLTIDHIVPRSKGGSNKPANLQTLCKHHNNRKGDDIIDYRKSKEIPRFKRLPRKNKRKPKIDFRLIR